MTDSSKVSRTVLRSLMLAVGTAVSSPVFAQAEQYSAPAVLNQPRVVRSTANQPRRLSQDRAHYQRDRTVESRWPRGTYQSPAGGRSRADSAPAAWTAPRAITTQRPQRASANSAQQRSRYIRYPQTTDSQTSRQRYLSPNSPAPRSWTAPAALSTPGYTTPPGFAQTASVTSNSNASDVQGVAGNQPVGVQSIATSAAQRPVTPAGLSSPVGAWQPAGGNPSEVATTASEAACDCGQISLLEQLHPESDFFVKGWVSQGFTWNPDEPRNNFNLPTTFNDRANEYQLNQLYVSMGIEAEESAIDWDVGAQIDLLYGSDYFFTTSVGLETHRNGTPRWNSDGPRNGGGAALYGLAMPQLFAEVWAPVGNGVSMKFGHFYTTLGHETVTAPDNFFYSHSYTMQYGEPFTHTGFLATTEVSDGVTVHGGFTRGWDNWEDPNSDLAFLGGVELNWDRTSLAYAVHVGDEDVIGDDTRSSYSLVLTHHLNDQWRYVFQHDLGYQQNGVPISLGTARWYGINQYLIADLTDCLSIGSRFEWFRDHNNARVLGVPAEGGNYFNYTFGLNWRPMPNMVVRPELRWDWSNVTPPFGLTGAYDDFSDKNQFTLGTDVILSF